MMQRILTSIFLVICAAGMQILADDVLVLRNGDIINSIVTEVTTTEVKYKKASNPNGPIYSVDKNDVLSIRYENGEIERFNQSYNYVESPINQSIPVQDSSELVSIVTANIFNDSIIKFYNSIIRPDKEPKIKNSTAKEFLVTWHFSPNSVLSCDDLRIYFEHVRFGPKSGYLDSYEYSADEYKINIKNNTNSMVYIDLSNSFKIDFDNKIHPFYTGEQVTEGGGNSVGGSMNLGAVSNALGIGGVIGTLSSGISLGNDKSNGASVTTAQQQYLCIPPKTLISLPGHKILTKKRDKVIEHYECFKFGNYYETWDKKVPNISPLNLKKNEIRYIDYEDSVFSIKYYITYSTDSHFTNVRIVPIELFPGVIDANGDPKCFGKIKGFIKLF